MASLYRKTPSTWLQQVPNIVRWCFFIKQSSNVHNLYTLPVDYSNRVQTSRRKSSIMFRLLQLLIAFTIVFHASAVDHCAPTYQPIEGDTCIDLSLCPTDAMSSMCSFLAFPVCGELNWLLTSSRNTIILIVTFLFESRMRQYDVPQFMPCET